MVAKLVKVVHTFFCLNLSEGYWTDEGMNWNNSDLAVSTQTAGEIDVLDNVKEKYLRTNFILSITLILHVHLQNSLQVEIILLFLLESVYSYLAVMKVVILESVYS